MSAAAELRSDRRLPLTRCDQIVAGSRQKMAEREFDVPRAEGAVVALLLC